MTSLLPYNHPDHRTLVNRANAALSTGPRTEEGKAASARNSVKHGLSGAGFAVLPTEDQDAFDQMHAGFVDHFQPEQPIEHLLVQELTQHYWLSQRAMRMQNLCFTEEGDLNDRRLSLSLRYLTTHRRLFDQIFQQLTELAAARSAELGFVSQTPAQKSRDLADPTLFGPSMPAINPKIMEEFRRKSKEKRENSR